MLIVSFVQEMLEAGAFMEEKQGWERPGYFKMGQKNAVAPYDWNGFYGYAKNASNVYEELLSGDCKYVFSDHFNVVCLWLIYYLFKVNNMCNFSFVDRR